MYSSFPLTSAGFAEVGSVTTITPIGRWTSVWWACCEWIVVVFRVVCGITHWIIQIIPRHDYVGIRSWIALHLELISLQKNLLNFIWKENQTTWNSGNIPEMRSVPGLLVKEWFLMKRTDPDWNVWDELDQSRLVKWSTMTVGSHENLVSTRENEVKWFWKCNAMSEIL